MKEVWKPVPEYEGLYEISNFGRVKSMYAERRLPGYILKEIKTQFGYFKCGLFKEKKGRGFMIHQLVAKTFIPNPEGKKFVNHRNGVKTDNRVDNLEWCTHAENMRHGIDMGLIDNRGSKNGMAKIDEETARLIKVAVGYHKDIAAQFGVGQTTVQSIKAGTLWKSI